MGPSSRSISRQAVGREACSFIGVVTGDSKRNARHGEHMLSSPTEKKKTVRDIGPQDTQDALNKKNKRNRASFTTLVSMSLHCGAMVARLRSPKHSCCHQRNLLLRSETTLRQKHTLDSFGGVGGLTVVNQAVTRRPTNHRYRILMLGGGGGYVERSGGGCHPTLTPSHRTLNHMWLWLSVDMSHILVELG